MKRGAVMVSSVFDNGERAEETEIEEEREIE